MANADITKYSLIKLDYLFCIIGIRVKKYEQHDTFMILGCGLHNLRIKKRKIE